MIFFPLPTFLPFIRIRYLFIALSIITFGAMIYVTIQYKFTGNCQGEQGVHYFLFSAIITVIVGTIMHFIAVKN